MAEGWLPIPCTDGSYEASDTGLIRNARTLYVLSMNTLVRGYPYVSVKISGRFRLRGAHILVAEAFLGPCPANHEVNHKDLIRTNSRPSNLEYVTHLENMRHAKANGHWPYRVGSQHPLAQVDEGDVLQIRALAEQGFRHVDIAAVFGINPKNVSSICAGRSWRHLAFSKPDKPKPSDDEVRQIRDLKNQGATTKELAIRFQVSEVSIRRYCNGRRRSSSGVQSG